MSRKFQWLLVPAIVLPASQAFAVQYLTVTESRRLLFPSADNFSLKSVSVNDAQAKTVKKMSGLPVQNRAYGVIVAERKGRIVGYLFQDQVLGKHESIDFVLAVDPGGTVLGVEILEYRETYGGEIRAPSWRRQFVGKSLRDPIALDKDIKNISGATLSCRHITDGVRRLLAIQNVALR